MMTDSEVDLLDGLVEEVKRVIRSWSPDYVHFLPCDAISVYIRLRVKNKRADIFVAVKDEHLYVYYFTMRNNVFEDQKYNTQVCLDLRNPKADPVAFVIGVLKKGIGYEDSTLVKFWQVFVCWCAGLLRRR